MAQNAEWFDRASRIRSLATSPEGQHVELKEHSYPKIDKSRSEFLKDVTSLANAGGGSILIGVREGKSSQPNTVVGVDAVEPELERLEAWATSLITPRIAGLEIFLETVFDKILIVIDVPEGTDKPHAFPQDLGDQFWIRVGNRCQRMSRHQLGDCFKQPMRDSRRVTAESLREDFRLAAREYSDFQGVYMQGKRSTEYVSNGNTLRGLDNKPTSYQFVTRKEVSTTAYSPFNSENTKWLEGHWVCLTPDFSPLCIRNPPTHGLLALASAQVQAMTEFSELSERASLFARDCAEIGKKAMPHTISLNWNDRQNLWSGILVEEEIHRNGSYGLLEFPVPGKVGQFDPETDSFYIKFKMNPFVLSSLILERFIAWLR